MIDSPLDAAANRRVRLRHHGDLEYRLLAYLREREVPFSEKEARHAYLKGQLDIIGALRRFARDEYDG